MPGGGWRERCSACRRALSACWCSHLSPLASRTRVCLLQHPRESKVAIGTARMAHLSLPNSELHVGVDFDGHPAVQRLVALPDTALLFPGEGAQDPSRCGRPPRNLIVVDGTWAQAKKLVLRNRCLQSLPRIGLSPDRPSNYRIRKEPSDTCVSTIEAVVQVLGELEGEPGRFLPLLRAFERMVDLQLERAAANDNGSRYRP